MALRALSLGCLPKRPGIGIQIIITLHLINFVRQVWMPKYKLAFNNEEVDTEERKRKVEGSAALKPPKKVKAEKPSKVIPDGDGAALDMQDMVVPVIPEGQLKRINKMIPSMEEMLHILASNLLEADAPESSEYVPTGPLTKAKDLETTTTTLLDKVKGFAETGKAHKSALKETFDECKEKTKQIISVNELLSTYLEQVPREAAAGGK